MRPADQHERLQRFTTSEAEGETAGRREISWGLRDFAARVHGELLQAAAERVGVEAEDPGGAVGALDHAARRPERVQDVGLLEIRQGPRRGRRRLAGLAVRAREVAVELQHRALAEDRRPLDDVLQLADVSGPAVRPQLLHAAAAQALDRLPETLREPREEEPDEQRNVLGPVAQWRDRHGNYVEAVQQVRPETSLGHGTFE